MNKKDIIETWEQMVALCVKKQIETRFGLKSDVDSDEPKKRAITVQNWIKLDDPKMQLGK